MRVEGLERLPAGPAVICFNHLNWADPIFIIAALPGDPRVFFFGPQQEDMSRGFRNRLMEWCGIAIPFKPGKRGLVSATRRVDEIGCAGGSIAIAGEGRIHAGESDLLPLVGGAAHFALRLGLPLVPLAVNGTSWLTFRGRVRIRVGEPLLPPRPIGHPTEEAVAELTAQAWSSLSRLVDDFPDKRRPGRFARWLTEIFNEWPEGSRPRQ